MRRRKPRRHVDVDATLYAGFIHRRKPASLTEVFTRSRRRNRAEEKREKRHARKGRR